MTPASIRDIETLICEHGDLSRTGMRRVHEAANRIAFHLELLEQTRTGDIPGPTLAGEPGTNKGGGHAVSWLLGLPPFRRRAKA